MILKDIIYSKMTQMFPFLLIIVTIMTFLTGYWLGSKESFAINCFSNDLIPIITPEGYSICWNKTLIYDKDRFELDLLIGGFENGT